MIHDFVHVGVPFANVKARMLESQDWLSPLVSRAYADAEEFRVRVGIGGGRTRLAKTVHLQVGQITEKPGGVVVPLRWEATGPHVLFPVLDANLEVAPVGASTTALTLWGSYAPPLDWIGRQMDRLVLHRVAEASVRSFLRQIADALEPAAGRSESATAVAVG